MYIKLIYIKQFLITQICFFLLKVITNKNNSSKNEKKIDTHTVYII